MNGLARDRRRRTWARPVALLPSAILEARRPFLAIGFGWLTAFLPSLVLGAVVSTWLPGLGQPQLPMDTSVALIAVVVVAPLLETLVMALVLSVLLLFATPTIAVILSAIGWGIAHSLLAPAWGLIIWWPFLVFSVLFVTWRRHSLAAGLAMPMIVHALQNLIPALLLFAAPAPGAV